MTEQYKERGYCLVSGFFNDYDVAKISNVVDRFHRAWIKDNRDFYIDKAINSAYLTGTKYLGDHDRKILFELISSDAIANIVSSLPFTQPAFMNTQLFFNPVNREQKNYWHRDPQYHLTPDEQRQVLQGAEVIHFRLALNDEPGIELVPGTHRRWDTDEELNIRLERAGCSNYHDISAAQAIPLKQGDLLIFSANMIHRGLYGGNRKALDILFCDARPELLEFVDDDCLPDAEALKALNHPILFLNTIKIRSQRLA